MLILLFFWIKSSTVGASIQMSRDLSMTPCEVELGIDGLGRYPQVISQQFAPGLVVANGRGRNLWCVCVTANRMKCEIFVRSGSLQEKKVFQRIQGADTSPNQRLKPFFLNSILYDNPGGIYDPDLFFELPGCKENQRVFCNIEIRHDPRLLTRSASAPSSLNYPNKFIFLSKCMDASEQCPITHEDFQPGKLVYILKVEEEKLKSGKCVVCISYDGLNNLQDSNADSFFRDPLRRTGDRMLQKNDFSLYLIVDDPHVLQPSNNGSSSKESPQYDPQNLELTTTFSRIPAHFYYSFLFFIFIIIFTFFITLYIISQTTPKPKCHMYTEFEDEIT